jgi:hypothetical protein
MVLSLAVALILSAQAPTSPQADPPRDPRARALDERRGTAIVRGRITDAETGAPLARIVVSLSLVGARAQRDTTSGADGAFAFTRLPAGEYTLLADPMAARRTTHAVGTYGIAPGTRSQKPSTIVLQDAEIFDKADIALPRAFVISARVLDDDGDPVADMMVRAERVGDRASPRTRSTDDRGAVRLWGYSPGAYIVCAVPHTAPDHNSAVGFVRTCYPSATSDSEAQPVTISTVDPPEVEIRLRSTRLFRVSGAVLDAAGAVAPSARVLFVTVDGPGVSARTTQQAGGGFEIKGVPPGEYFVAAEIGDAFIPGDTPHQTGYTPVSVQTSDVDGVTVLTSPPATVRGRLVFEGAVPAESRGTSVRPVPARGSVAVLLARSSSSPIAPDLSFELRGLFGAQLLEVDPPRGWIVKSVRYRGEERADVPTEFKSARDPS